ncbi:hypothetical protein [Pseudomonas moraviensis]|uniref:hypothetical protein n=1 Tax=Pseudomonas moraviensis TaxID=321662 RepID=UPI001E3F9D94|nr:hypothetical protein [Pseudomonas moraviensis]
MGLAHDGHQVAFYPVGDVGLTAMHGLLAEGVVEGQAQDAAARAHGFVDPHAGDAYAVAVARDGVEFFAHLRFARAVGVADFFVPGLFAFGRGLLPRHVADALIEAVGDGVVEGGAVDLGAVAVALVADVADHLVKGVGFAIVGADDDDAPAPDEQCGGGVEYGGDVTVESGFINDDFTLQASHAGGVAGECDDFET